jgi:hypothetical protein
MGKEETLPSARATDGSLEIHVAYGSPVNTWGQYFEGMPGMLKSKYDQQQQAQLY